MVNKKLSRILGPMIGCLGGIFALGAVEPAVLAQENVKVKPEYTNSATTSAAVTCKDYFININKSEIQNGIKVTVDKAVATKHKLNVVLKIESEKTLDKLKHDETIFEVTYGNETRHSFTNSRQEYIDDKTMIVTLEKDNKEQEYPETGEMRVDVVLSKYKVNIGIDAQVDFTEAFKNEIEKDISGKIPELNYTLNKLETDVMGTRISYSKPQKDESADTWHNPTLNPTILLKVGDKMYKTDSNGSYSEKGGVKVGNYESKLATYDKVKDEKNISIIPLSCNIKFDELHKMNEQNKEKEDAISKETSNNVSYDKTFNFADGSKGQIYNIERNDNIIKIYCKGESEKESLLMASNMNIFYKNIKEQNDNLFYNNTDVSLYKDPKDTLGYIVEFDNVKKDATVELSFDSTISHAERYSLGNEVKLLN